MRRNAENRSDSTHLAAITTGPAMSDLRELRLYTKEILPDIAHETGDTDPGIAYTYDATTIQNCSVGKTAETTPEKVVEAMTLPAKAQKGAASDKEGASLKLKTSVTSCR